VTTSALKKFIFLNFLKFNANYEVEMTFSSENVILKHFSPICLGLRFRPHYLSMFYWKFIVFWKLCFSCLRFLLGPYDSTSWYVIDVSDLYMS